MKRRLLLLLATVLGLVLVTGCASIPSSGPVHTERDQAGVVDDSAVRLLAPPPQKGAPPESIVRGFLLAAADFDADHARAREYLAPDIRQRWRPDQQVRVIDAASLDVRTEGSRVTVSVAQVAQINEDGGWSWLGQPRTISVPFALAKVGAEWRISGLDDGLLLTVSDVERAYRSSQAYFLDRDRKVVVPDLILLPIRQDMATALTNRVLGGPTSWLAPAVVSAFPAGTTLVDGTVTMSDGVAQVDLTEQALRASPEDRKAMSAQLVWTLRQLPGVTAVDITVQGGDFAVPGATPPQTVDSWASFDPGVLPGTALAYVVRNGALGAFSNGEFDAVPGPAGNGAEPLTDPAVSIAGDLVAGLVGARHTVVRGAIGIRDHLSPVLTGSDFGAPSWDRSDNLWVLDRAGTGLVRVVTPHGAVVDVAVSGLGNRRLVALRVSRDGARVMAVTRSRGATGADQLMVGVVVREVGGSAPATIRGLTPVAPALVDVQDMAWLDGETLAVVAKTADSPLQPSVLSADGFTSAPTSLISNPVSVAAAPAPRPLLVETADHVIHALAGGRSWQNVGKGTNPTYPG